MKNLSEIYEGIKDKFYKRSKIDIEPATVLDCYFLASSDMIEKAYQEIEKNKNPHLYTNLKGENIDELGIIVGLQRKTDESDKNYLYRVLNWNVANKASNLTAIENSLMDMTNASYATYVPLAFGCSTAAVFIIAKNNTESGRKLAIEETKERLKGVVSPTTYIEYIVPTPIAVKLILYLKADASDKENIKNNITEKIMKYVNGIAPGEYLELGKINSIGIKEPNVSYFNASHLTINNQETSEVAILQTIKEKFLLIEDNIEWIEVN